MPLYLLSRLGSLVFPLGIVFLLSYYNLWNTVDTLQLSMLIVYLALELFIFILFTFLIRTIYLQWHIMPGREHLGESISKFTEYIQEYFYPHLISIPIATFLIHYYCGHDIGRIIVSYLPLTAVSGELMFVDEWIMRKRKEKSIMDEARTNQQEEKPVKHDDEDEGLDEDDLFQD